MESLMNEFLSNVNSLYWWISVVVVGILLNVISSYSRDWIDRALSRISGWWANRSDVRRQKEETAVQYYAENDLEFISFQLENLRDRLVFFVCILSAAGLAALVLMFQGVLSRNELTFLLSFFNYFTFAIGLLICLTMFATTARIIQGQQIIYKVNLSKTNEKKYF